MLLSFSATSTCLPCRMQHSSCWEHTTSALSVHWTLKPHFGLQSKPSYRQTSNPLLVSYPTTMNTGESLDTQLRSCPDQLLLALSEKLLSSAVLTTDLLSLHCLHSLSRVLPSDNLGRIFLSFSQWPQGERWARLRARSWPSCQCSKAGCQKPGTAVPVWCWRSALPGDGIFIFSPASVLALPRGCK